MPGSIIRAELSKSLVLKSDNGVNEEGESLYTSKSFSNIRQGATDDNLFKAANILGDLQENDLVEVSVVEKNILMG